MGLHNTAHYLKTKGRGRDTELVHMSPREIKGLQALALAHGGSLTINPETGLPEAGFLEQILPMVAGAGLMMIPGVGPLAAAALVGGGYGLATGSVEKGLMAGLGAYGGAGITSSLASAGTEAARAAAEQTAIKGFETTAQEAVKSGVADVAAEAAKTAALEGTTLPANYADLYAQTGGAQQITQDAAQKFVNAQNFPGLTPTQIQASQASVPDLIAGGSSPSQVMGSLGRASATQAAPTEVTAGNVARGLKEVGTSVPAAGSFLGSNVGTLGSAAVPFLVGDQQQGAGPAGYQEDEYDERLKKYKLSPDYQAYEAPRPNPYYSAQYAAEGGVMKLAAGGSFDNESGMDEGRGLYQGNMTNGFMNMGSTPAYAAGGQIDMGNGYNPFANLPPMSGPLGSVGGGQRPAGMQPMGVSDGFNPFSSELRNNPQIREMIRVAGGGRDEQGRPVDGLGNVIERTAPSGQPFGSIMSGLSGMFPGTARTTQLPPMQARTGQYRTAQEEARMDYPQVVDNSSTNPNTNSSSFAGPKTYYGNGFGGGFGGGGGSGGPFPLEGQYGIVKMADGGIARYRNRGQVNVLQDYIDRQEQQQMGPLPESVGVPRTGIFRDTDVDTARKDALSATMIRLGKIGKGAGIKPVALTKTAIKGLGDIRGATPEIEQAAAGGAMRYNLGGYSDGGRMLKGPGDGMSDSIPATIAGKQPARLADGEFVVPADVVSHLGNGSTDAGAKKLYSMMNKIRKARTGKKKQAPAVKANKYMPA
jgi:hypothetical protein